MSEHTEPRRIAPDFQEHATRAFGFDEPPETYEAFWHRMVGTFADALGREVSVDDLCTTDESPHRATVDGETRYYRCATDALLFGVYSDREVTVRTVSPVSGSELLVEFDADGVVAAPDGAVLSFGVERSVDVPDGPVTPERMYGRFCPYSRAFTSRAEYREWTESHPEVVADGQPLGAALELQARLVSDLSDADEADGSGEAAGGTRSC